MGFSSTSTGVICHEQHSNHPIRLGSFTACGILLKASRLVAVASSPKSTVIEHYGESTSFSSCHFFRPSNLGCILFQCKNWFEQILHQPFSYLLGVTSLARLSMRRSVVMLLLWREWYTASFPERVSLRLFRL
jgi:hypothetical protein